MSLSLLAANRDFLPLTAEDRAHPADWQRRTFGTNQVGETTIAEYGSKVKHPLTLTVQPPGHGTARRRAPPGTIEPPQSPAGGAGAAARGSVATGWDCRRLSFVAADPAATVASEPSCEASRCAMNGRL